MNLDSYIEETMDEAMRPYTDSETYKTGRTQINCGCQGRNIFPRTTCKAVETEY